MMIYKLTVVQVIHHVRQQGVICWKIEVSTHRLTGSPSVTKVDQRGVLHVEATAE